MSVTKEITVLALTKMHGGVCTAGIDADGRWVRPVRPHERAQHVGVTEYCLLPLDFFHGGRSHLANLAVTNFCFTGQTPQPPHVEDWTLDTKRKPRFIRKLTEEEQEQFLAAHAESDLAPLRAARERSLILIKPESFSFSFGLNQTGEDVSVRGSFTFHGEKVNDVGCTDLRMRALGRQMAKKMLEKSGDAKCSLASADFERQGKRAIYLSVGLSRLFQNKHWLILVGVHTVPELSVEIDYAKL